MSITVTIERMDRGPRLVIEEADELAVCFFSDDASSVGRDPYDSHSGKGVDDRITDGDVTVMNQTMRARSPHDKWTSLTESAQPLPGLAELDPDWCLFAMEESTWERQARPAMKAALDATVGPYRNLAVATKVLHLKRPGLFPVLDSLVANQIGAGSQPAMEMIRHLRSQGRMNLPALEQIRRRLAATIVDGRALDRTRVRILDGLLWTSHPLTSLDPRSISAWERVIRPKRTQ